MTMNLNRTLSNVCMAVLMSLFLMSVQAQDKLKVVYHVSEAGKVPFVLNNMRNHIKGVGGPENVELVLVAHGPALKRFHEMEADEKVSGMFSELKEEGVRFDACGNTMRAFSYKLEDLLPGFICADEGGVVRIATLQSQGYLYIRP